MWGMLVRILWLFMVLLPTNALWAQPALEVFVSGSFRSSMVEIVPQFEKSTGIRVNVSSGPASGTTATSLATRLREGKKFDAVILAGSSGVEELVNEGLIRLAASTPLARTFLGVAVRAGMPKPDLRSVDGFRKALLSAKRIAVANGSPGVHMRE
ncbi:MAG: hypothetical protein RL328_977, partial [Acidobacteriota bacterium]